MKEMVILELQYTADQARVSQGLYVQEGTVYLHHSMEICD
jgi:hypothetical protein